MKLYLLIMAAALLLISFSGYGQETMRIFGTLTDSVTHEPVPYATVSLLNQQTKAAVKATHTDTSGHFVLENVPAGTFSLRVSAVRYNILKEDIVINSATGDLNAGTLLMTASNNNVLEEVIVAAKKQALQTVKGKRVSSVNQSLVSKGGNAADLLQNIPTLQIDGNGNVNLRGSSDVNVLIDGKPSIIGNGNIARLLKSIPANAIESIEVIPNPPASYEANGEGVINIILKRNSRPGLNGSADIAGGTNDNFNFDASLSYQAGKANVYGNYSLKDGNTVTTGYQRYVFLQPTDSVVHTSETFPDVTRDIIQFLKGGIEYSITPGSALELSASFNSRNSHEDQFLSFTHGNAADALIESFNRFNTVNNNGSSYELDIDFKQHWKRPKEELAFNFAFAYGSFRDYQYYSTRYNPVNGVPSAKLDTPLISDTRHKATNYNIQADYILPVGKAGQFSAGYRSQITLGSNDQYAYSILSQGETPQYALTDLFTSNNQVNAVYLNLSNQIGHFSYQAGVRGEDSRLDATFMSYDSTNILVAIPVIVAVKGIYPSVLLAEKLKNNTRLQFTFARRISEPSVRQFNSTTDFSDPTNYNQGNPRLKPAGVIDLGFDYIKTWPHISFTSGIYNNTVTNAVHPIQELPVNDETTTIPENLKRAITTGLEIIGVFDILKGWDLTANANIFDRYNAAAPQYGIAANNGISWNANITTNVRLIQRLAFQIHADYKAPYMNFQDRYRANFGMDGAAKYDFAGNRASLSCNAIDIFNSRKRAVLRSSDDLIINLFLRTVGARATLTFSYRFGRDPSRQKASKQVKRIEDAS
ncbi:MAG TPA: outer membrane beta-barrel protein [Puia sp.]|nr:outer membrane beta-barrel protein [Puia sp.]